MKLVGFNRRTDRLAVEKATPAEAASAVRTIANVPASDPDLRASYQLTEEQVRQIAERDVVVTPYGAVAGRMSTRTSPPSGFAQPQPPR